MLDWFSNFFDEALDLFSHIVDILLMPVEILNNATDAINTVQFDKMLLHDYLGYMHYAMGTPLFVLFSTVALISIAIAIYNVIMKGIELYYNVMPYWFIK